MGRGRKKIFFSGRHATMDAIEDKGDLSLAGSFFASTWLRRVTSGYRQTVESTAPDYDGPSTNHRIQKKMYGS